MPVLQPNISPRSKSASPNETMDDFVDQDKVRKYEDFLNEVLRADLKTTLDRRDEMYNEISQYMELQTILEKVMAANDGDEGAKLKTRVDIGSNFYVQAEIPNTKTITVDIGCGIWLPMGSKDALKFSEKKLLFLNARVDELTQKELSIKAQIKLVLEGLREIQRISVKEPTPRYES